MSASASPRSAALSNISSLTNSESSHASRPSTRANRSSGSSRSTRRSRELPNSIVLFVKAHGLEMTKTSFVRNLAMRFEELEIDDDPLSIAESNVRLSLGTDKVNYTYGHWFDKDKKHGIGLLSEPILDVLLTFIGQGDKEAGKRVIPETDLVKLLDYMYERHIFSLGDIRLFSAQIFSDIVTDITEPGFLTIQLDRDRLRSEFYGLCGVVGQNYQDALHIYNDMELLGINVLVSYFCLGNKGITKKAYNYCRKLLKQQTDNYYDENFGDFKRCNKLRERFLEEADRERTEEDEYTEYFSESAIGMMREHDIGLLMKRYGCSEILPHAISTVEKFKKSNKFLDFEIKRKSTDRLLQFHANDDEPPNSRAYGIYIIKAQLNGDTYCNTHELVSAKSISDLFKDSKILLEKSNYRTKITAEQWRLMEEEVIRNGINDIGDIMAYTTLIGKVLTFTLDGKARFFSIFEPITTNREGSEMAIVTILKILTNYSQTPVDNRHLLLSYSNPFIKRIIDAMPEGRRKTFIMKFFDKKHVEFSNVVAVCKALGFEYTFAYDPCCRSPCDSFARRVDALGIPYMYGILKQVGLETEEKLVELRYDDYEEKKKQLIFVYHTITKDPLLISLFDNRVIPFLDEVREEYFEELDEDAPPRSPLKAMQPRSRSIDSPMIHKPRFVQKSRYRADDVVDFHVPGKRANLFRRGKIVSGTKADGYTIRCFDPTCGNLADSTGIYENVPYSDIVQYEDFGDFVNG